MKTFKATTVSEDLLSMSFTGTILISEMSIISWHCKKKIFSYVIKN